MRWSDWRWSDWLTIAALGFGAWQIWLARRQLKKTASAVEASQRTLEVAARQVHSRYSILLASQFAGAELELSFAVKSDNRALVERALGRLTELASQLSGLASGSTDLGFGELKPALVRCASVANRAKVTLMSTTVDDLKGIAALTFKYTAEVSREMASLVTRLNMELKP